ncbi:MAG: glycosyl hydrolase 115 family protein [Ignavibacteriae bacterium]|nr:glycosyl hydrolase 115 family protein [Ignavibacteriota bacterium]
MEKLNKIIFLLLIIININFAASEDIVSETKLSNSFPIVENKIASQIIISSSDFQGVHKVASWLQSDIEKVSNVKPDILIDEFKNVRNAIIIGTINQSKIIDQLISARKIDENELLNKWEKFVIQIVENPLPNIEKALVIVGSDKRGTIYGMLELSKIIGVSPWYWWADVQIKKKENIYFNKLFYTNGEPKVKYRGIFINDEAPALSGWANEKFGTDKFNHKFYENVFELILRLKGNFLWPAMWGRAFYDDDSLNGKIADELGVVIGTSHHEPMMRAHDEWRRYGNGKWNYATNENELKKFWRDGINKTKNYDKIITLAMRGDGDEAMSEDANVSLLEKIVHDQREIIYDEMQKPLEEIPQVWALYKEVQEYYDKGMKVPDDVTILLCDDNWGNLRILPKLNEPKRKGGFGIYYHYDYVGGPRNYKWLNTNQIERVYEQMNLAYYYGADKIWVVNVGDIKPMEFPISFFLDFAWNPTKINSKNLDEFYITWVNEQFGEKFQNEIAEVLKLYTKYSSRRKPELLSPETYSLTNYREFENIVKDYNTLLIKAQTIYNQIQDENKDAFYQLVLHPVEACANLNELYYIAAKNKLYAKQGRILTNELAKKVKELFEKDKSITNYYNNILADGKWNHMMDQTHIGYTNWQQPDSNKMPNIVEINNSENAEGGIYIEGNENSSETLIFPRYDNLNQQNYYFEIYNKGKKSFDFNILKSVEWIKLSKVFGSIKDEERIYVEINWENIPDGFHKEFITVKSLDKEYKINLEINNNSLVENISNRFIENNGVISIDAENFNKKIKNNKIEFEIIPNLGRTALSVISVPVFETLEKITNDSPHLEYDIFSFSKDSAKIKLYFSPTLNFTNNTNGIRYAISMNDEIPQIVNITSNPNPPDLNYDRVWNKWVAENINIQQTKHFLKENGNHTLKIWLIDPGIVLQKIVIDFGGLKESYLGPAESKIYNSN